MDFRRLISDDEFRKNIIFLGLSLVFVCIVFILVGIDWGGETIKDTTDTVGPKVVRVTSLNDDGIYTINQNIDIVVEFNEEIDVSQDGEPRIALQLTEDVVKYAEYVNNKSKTEMTFRYSIKKGDETEKLEYTSEDALEARGTVVRDKNGNVSSLLLPLTSSDNSLGGNKEIQIITEDPYAIITEYQKTKELKEYTIVFNRKVDDFDISDIQVYEGSKANFRIIEENRIYKVDVIRSTTVEQTIVVPAGVCTDIENGIPNTYSVPIPKGFYYYGGNKETGIVLTDNAREQNTAFYDYGTIIPDCAVSNYGNNYVWVPIDYVNDSTGTYSESSSGNSVVKNSRFGRRDFGIYGYGTFDDYSETIPTAVVSSIKKYCGFYVGRYEGILGSDGRMGSKRSVKNSLGYVGREKSGDNKSILSLYNYVSASTAASAINKTYSSAAAVVAHLPYAAEWDTLMKWIEESDVDVAYDSTSWGNYANAGLEGVKIADQQNILETGITDYTQTKHIYDLAGNLWEWTQERTKQGNVVRGGVYGNIGSEAPAAYRTTFGSTANTFLCTSRPFLYVK